MTGDNATNLFNDIYDSTNRNVLGFITAKCANISDVSDIFQDTYIEVYSAILRRGINYIENPEAFVIKIARQKLWHYYSLLDKLKRILPLTEKNREGDEFCQADIQTDAFSIDDKICDDILIEEIKDLLSQKPQEIQKIFYLFYYLNITIPEISKLLCMSESNVKHKLYRTLNELRNLYVKKESSKQ